MSGRRVVVTGIGTINPLGHNIEEYFKNLQDGVSAAAPITHFDASKFRSRIACEVKDYDWTRYFDRKEVRKYDRFAQFAMISADEALRDAALVENDAINLERVGVVWGSGTGGTTTFYEECKGYVEGNYTPRFSPFFVPRMVVDLAAGFISIKYGFMGPNYSTVSACASSNHAMIDALNLIRWGKADIVVTGGSEASINEPGVGSFCGMQALSTRNDDAAHASRPFDAQRDGFVIAEGGGALIFEELEHAQKRGAKIYCEVVGGGMSADAYHMTAPHPEGKGAMIAMRGALEDAGMEPCDIDYINAHGTSTQLGDVAEIKAIVSLFGDHAYNLNISSTKSMTGHLLGGTAAIEALACVMAITQGVIPPTINVETLDSEIDSNLNLTLGVCQHREVRAALSNTFGFGGHNSTIIFRKM
ncbi:MAG: beta-ketoacyl-ACP synthase II [Alistipes sp.]|nr:beta-ketoacyl-ACP synthase II [Alistipes sp.]MBR2628945.1 beta-ketoacyl-ACP synthase II [Alistipes sp.]